MKTKSALRSFLFLAGSSLLTISSASAQSTYTWANSNVTGTPTSPLDWFTGGSNTQGTWNGGDPASSNLNTIQIFENITTTLPNTANPSTQTVNLNNGGSPFALGTLILSGRGSATTNANLTMTLSGDALNFSDASGAINLDAVNNSRTITYSATHDIKLGTASSGSVLNLTGNGNSAFNIDGIISELQSGGGSLVKSGTSTVSLSGANTYTGATTASQGTLNVRGASGTINLSSGITLAGGNITLTNTNATEGAVDRIKDDANITSYGGTFTYTNTAGANNVYAETLGPVGLVGGQTNFALTTNQNNATNNSQTLTLSDLTRTGATNTSAVSFGSNSGLNTTKNIISVDGASGSGTGSGQIIGPWAFYGTTPASPTDYAVHDAGGLVLNASIGATTEDTWTSGTNVTLNASTTLTDTRTVNTLRTSGAATLNLGASNFNLETYGLLNGGTNLTISTTGSGGLTTPSGGGYLYLTPGAATMTVSAPIKDNGDAVTVVKSGGSTLTLSSTANNFSGGTVINAGTVAISSDSNFGAASGEITINGPASLSYADGLVLNGDRNLAINQGGTLTLGANITLNGVLSGNGTLFLNSSDDFKFFNANNDFSGTIIANTSGSTTYGLRMASIGDGPGAGLINLGGIGTGSGTFWWESASGIPTTFANRQFALSGTTGGGVIAARGATASDTLTITKDLLVTGVGNKTLTLGGTNSGVNVFGGNITDGINGGASVISLTKSDSLTWALSGTNTYSGNTNLLAAFGRLVFQGSQSLSPNTKLVFTQSSSNVHNVRFLDDGAGTIDFNRPIEFGGSNTSQVLGIFVGNNNTANQGSSSGTTTGSTIQVGDITHTSIASDTGTWTISPTSSDGYRLQTGTITLNNLVSRTGAQTTTTILNPTTANMTVGAVTMATGNITANDGTPVLRLDGTSGDNIVTGTVSNASDYLTGHALNVEKTNVSTWRLQGTNTYTGTTTVSAGILNFEGSNSMSASSPLSVSANAAASLADGTVDTGNTTSALTLANGSILAFDWVNGATDTLTSTAAATTLAGGVGININAVGTPSGGPHTLISSPNGGLDTTDYYLTGSTGFTATLSKSSTAVTISGFTTTSAPADAYWKGSVLNGSAGGSMSLTDGSTTNWTTDAAGSSPSAVIPGDGVTNIIFSATGATQHTTISASGSMDLGSLTFNDGTAVTITSPYPITLNNTSGTAAATTAARATITNASANAISAISVTSFANGTNTINAPIILGGNQTWNVANGKTLTVSGEVSGDSSLTKADAGTVVLSAFPTYTGTTTISGGKLQINAGGLSSSDTISLNADGATLQFGSNGSPGVSGTGGAYISNPIVVGSSVTSTGAKLWVNGNQGGWRFTGGITGAGSGAQTLLFDNRAGLTVGGDRNTTTFSGVISDGTNGGNLGLSFLINPQTPNNTHPSYVNLTAANTFTGDITASRTVGGSTSWLTIGGEKWSDGPNNTPTYGKEGTGYLGANNGGNYTGNIRFGNANLVNLAYYSSANQTLSGTIGGTSANNGTLVMDGSGTLTLSGTNTYTGTTTVNKGKLLINGDQTSATGAVSVSANATLGGKGIIGGDTTIADSGKFEFNLSTVPGSHDKLDLASGKTLTFSGTSTLTLTTTGGTTTGPYTLVSAPGGISGSVPATVVLPVGWTADAPTISGGTDLVINITSTGGGATPYDTWADGTFTNPFTDTLPGSNPDGDSLTNLQEFAFGTDPTVSSGGSITYVANGEVTSPGLPVAVNLASPGVDFRAVFGRRKDYVAAGLIYTVQFSAGLDAWVDSEDTPTELSDSTGDIDAVSVPYPLFIDTVNGSEKPTFFRVGVSETTP